MSRGLTDNLHILAHAYKSMHILVHAAFTYSHGLHTVPRGEHDRVRRQDNRGRGPIKYERERRQRQGHREQEAQA